MENYKKRTKQNKTNQLNSHESTMQIIYIVNVKFENERYNYLRLLYIN